MQQLTESAGQMMRIRTVKPAFFKHRELYELDRDTGMPCRLAYEALWGVCDRSGRFEWKPSTLKTDVLPHDPFDMQEMLRVLAGQLYVVQYIVRGRGYGWCPTMPVHQNINARESASLLPPPPRSVVAWYQAAILAQNMGQTFDQPNPLSDAVPFGQGDSQNGTPQALLNSSGASDASSTRQLVPSDASRTRADAPSLPAVTEDSLTETDRARADAGRLGEHAGALVTMGNQHALPAIRGKRDVPAIIKRLAQTLDEVTAGNRPQLDREQWRRIAVEFVFAYWAKSFEKPASFLSSNDKREQKIVARMKENGDDLNEILWALDGVKRSKYHMGENDAGVAYTGIETLLRDRVQVEKFSAMAAGYKRGELHPMLVKYAPVLLSIGAPDALRARLDGQGEG